jgi:predicted dinucleotide-binding enzyme
MAASRSCWPRRPRRNQPSLQSGWVLATASSVPDAIAAADAVVLALWLEPMKEVIESCFDALDGKVVIDPFNPLASDGKSGFERTLPDGVSAGSVVVGMLPSGAHYVKAFGTLSAETLASVANREPESAVLFYATDDAEAESVAERLIAKAGFAPVKVGGVEDAVRIEVGGDLHQLGGLEGKLLDIGEAQAAIAASHG